MKEPVTEYCETFPHWSGGFDGIPEYMREGLARYVLHGTTPGSFLSAVICNDLMGALGKADDTNRNKLWEYCNFFYNYAPSTCFGSPESFTKWCAEGGTIGRTLALKAETAGD